MTPFVRGLVQNVRMSKTGPGKALEPEFRSPNCSGCSRSEESARLWVRTGRTARLPAPGDRVNRRTASRSPAVRRLSAFSVRMGSGTLEGPVAEVGHRVLPSNWPRACSRKLHRPSGYSADPWFASPIRAGLVAGSGGLFEGPADGRDLYRRQSPRPRQVPKGSGVLGKIPVGRPRPADQAHPGQGSGYDQTTDGRVRSGLKPGASIPTKQPDLARSGILICGTRSTNTSVPTLESFWSRSRRLITDGYHHLSRGASSVGRRRVRTRQYGTPTRWRKWRRPSPRRMAGLQGTDRRGSGSRPGLNVSERRALIAPMSLT